MQKSALTSVLTLKPKEAGFCVCMAWFWGHTHVLGLFRVLCTGVSSDDAQGTIWIAGDQTNPGHPDTRQTP